MGMPSMMPTDTAAMVSIRGCALLGDHLVFAGEADGLGKRHVGAGDGGGAGAAVGLQDVAVQHDGVLAEGLGVDDGTQRAADQPGNLVGAAADQQYEPNQ